MDFDERPRIAKPAKGISVWRTPYDMVGIAFHWTSDPGKDQEWFKKESGAIPGGEASDSWRQEQEMDTRVIAGRPTYWAWNYGRNVIPDWPVNQAEMRQWDIWLSADFGVTDPTCWLFWAEDPFTHRIVIWDSIYKSNTPILQIKEEIYDKIASFYGIDAKDLQNLRDHVRYAVGDPSGLGYMQEYNVPPMPVHVFGNTRSAKVKLNDRYAGEQRLNALLSPQFTCCGKRYYQEWFQCPTCAKINRGYSRLVIMEGACPELLKQIPSIRKALPKHPGLEHPDRDVKVPDHAVDAAKYGVLTRSLELGLPQGFRPAPTLTSPLTGASKRFSDHLARLMATAAKASEEAGKGEEDDEDYNSMSEEQAFYAAYGMNNDEEDKEENDDEF